MSRAAPRRTSRDASLRDSAIIVVTRAEGTGMHPNEVLARREMELIKAGDLEALEHIYASELVIHYPGRNPLSGTPRTGVPFEVRGAARRGDPDEGVA